MGKRCKIEGTQSMTAVQIKKGKFVIYLGKEKYSKQVTRKQAKKSLGIIIPKKC